MKYLIVLACVAACAVGRPGASEVEPLPFHFRSTGDVDGSYSFSYAAEDSSKTETRDADGTVIGGYQYVDADGVLQKVQYKASAEDGVQILATNLPVGSTEPVQDTPEVLKAAEEHYHHVKKALRLIERARLLAEEYERKQAARKAAAAQHH